MAETATLTRIGRIDLAEKAWKEGRIIQGNWRRNGGGGREMVCALAAFGPDINGSGDCPADLMPPWLAALVPSIDDGITASEVPWFAGELIARARRWHILDDAAWERIRTGFMIAGIKRAIESARPVQPDPSPEYWQPVVDACDQVVKALETGEGLAEARAAARAAAGTARAAAEAAGAARAARAAARAARAAEAAAEAAARAAEAAAGAAAGAAWEAAGAAGAAWEATRAALAAAWKSLAETLFQLIDLELEAAQGTKS